MKKRRLVVPMISLLLLTSCNNGFSSTSDLLSSSNLEASSSISSESSASSSISSSFVYENVDESLPDYEKVNRQDEYVDDDNYRNFYHIFVPSFADSNGDGVGDLQGIIDKIDYLRASDPHQVGSLGINGLYLSPINPAGSYHKYDITDYENIDSEFGTLETFDTLINLCHQRGIKVIMDMVLNHSAYNHPLFLQALDALKNITEFDENGRPLQKDIEAHPVIDYFRFVNKNYTLSESSGYSNRLYTTNVGDWYFEGFSSGMADWNLENTAVQALHKQYLEFWLARGVDGFRLDAVQSFFGESSIDLNRNYNYINYINKVVKDYAPSSYIIAEGPWNIASCSSYMENTDIDSYFDFSTSFQTLAARYDGLMNRFRYSSLVNGNLKSFFDLSNKESSINPQHIDAYFSSNHDLGRMTNQFALYKSNTLYLNELKFFYAVQGMFGGNYFLYYGDEIGAMGVKQGDDDTYCRSPFNWGDSYTPQELTKDQNVPTQAMFGNFYTQVNNKDSLFNFFRQLNRVKEVNPEIARGQITSIEGENAGNLLKIYKTYKDKEICILINSSLEEITTSLSEVGENKNLVNCLSTSSTYASVDISKNLVLPSLSVTIVK